MNAARLALVSLAQRDHGGAGADDNGAHDTPVVDVLAKQQVVPDEDAHHVQVAHHRGDAGLLELEALGQQQLAHEREHATAEHAEPDAELHDDHEVDALELAHGDEHERLADGAQQSRADRKPRAIRLRGGVVVPEDETGAHHADQAGEGQQSAREAGDVDVLVQQAGSLLKAQPQQEGPHGRGEHDAAAVGQHHLRQRVEGERDGREARQTAVDQHHAVLWGYIQRLTTVPDAHLHRYTDKHQGLLECHGDNGAPEDGLNGRHGVRVELDHG
ncbi:hypothetical protein ON010_g16266 [Phytophthora cinnamomi]|nr:hypothetical protein ON010_g16266 [Phytophthora cinnamomi]